jgi:hypothetical protein
MSLKRRLKIFPALDRYHPQNKQHPTASIIEADGRLGIFQYKIAKKISFVFFFFFFDSTPVLCIPSTL